MNEWIRTILLLSLLIAGVAVVFIVNNQTVVVGT